MELDDILLLTAVENEDEKVLRLMDMCRASSAAYFTDNERSVWCFERYGTFWERDVPLNSDDVFKESFRVERSIFKMLVKHLYALTKKKTSFRLFNRRYRFMYINVGCPGRCHDSQIHSGSKLKSMLEETPLLRENGRTLCGIKVPVVVLGDSAFKFSTTVMKPYPSSVQHTEEQRAFNYNLSKARRVVENAFGHLKARFRRIGKGLDNNISKASNIIVCCVILHNFLNENNSHINENWERDDVDKRQQPEHTTWLGNHDEQAQTIRHALGTYFVNR